VAGETNKKRVADLEAALKRAKPRDRLYLEDLALLWGTTKPRFVTVRNAMADFPESVDRDGNRYIYLAKPALQAMVKHERRHDSRNKIRADRAAAILGKTRGGGAADDNSHTPNELATLSRLAAEAEERERAQRMYIPAAEVYAVAGDVYAEISDFASRLSNEIDPHGELPAEVRVKIDKRGQDALLRCHRAMKAILTPNAQPVADRGASNRSGKPRPRR
jgi:hypothetical protein